MQKDDLSDRLFLTKEEQEMHEQLTAAGWTYKLVPDKDDKQLLRIEYEAPLSERKDTRYQLKKLLEPFKKYFTR